MQRGKQTARQFKVLELLENSRFGLTTREIRDQVIESLGLSSLHEKNFKNARLLVKNDGQSYDVTKCSELPSVPK